MTWNLDVCTVCGKTFTLEWEESIPVITKNKGIRDPKYVSHCKGGKHLIVPGRIAAFYELINGEQVEVEPIFVDGF
jgi:hypothetical protein